MEEKMIKKQKNIEDMTLNELKSLVKEAETIKEEIQTKGKSYCIVRTYSAGVFAGNFDRKTKGKEGTIYNARRIFYWDGAASLSQMANEGVKKPENCKFAQEVSEIDLREIIEVLPCTTKAKKNIQAVKVWEQ